jgi:3-carboxy-cis,cis-muconate cycloisomerase
MSDLFWPGDARAGALFTDESFVAAMVAVESAWVGTPLDLPGPDLEAEAGGNAVIPLVECLRKAYPDLEGLHEGLTSQDVLDTALVLMLRDAVTTVRGHLADALGALDALAAEHGQAPMTGRTLTQPALPISFGDKVGSWRAGLAEADRDLSALSYPAQAGGPVGTGSNPRLAQQMAQRLGLDDVPAWHTMRRPLTRAGDALVAATDACGRIARDVLVLSRPEIGELSDAHGGGSSSMPHKSNPVLSVLVRRAALTTPALIATLHLCAADQVDERADGAWHAEWETLRLLARRTAVATSQTADLLRDLRVHPDRMAANLTAAEEVR